MTQVEHIYYHYTIAALEDVLVKTISSKNTFHIDEDENGENEIRIHWMYLEQAEALLDCINIYDPLPEFVIFTEDIPEGLIQALDSLGKVLMKRVITNAVRRIYESIDPEYFHTNGIYGKIRWRLVS
jgi:hypothetical protein